jgi:hypothetical protein
LLDTLRRFIRCEGWSADAAGSLLRISATRAARLAGGDLTAFTAGELRTLMAAAAAASPTGTAGSECRREYVHADAE